MEAQAPRAPWPATTSDWVRFVAGFGLVFALFQALAYALKSFRGEWGAAIAAAILAAIALYSVLALRETYRQAVAKLGLAKPTWSGMVWAGAVSGLLLLTIPAALGDAWSLYGGAGPLAVGIFLQGGVAEEALFRSYLFGRLRPGRSFRRAAALSMIPFLVAHLYLPFTMEPAIAAASILLSVITAFPLAKLYELGGNTLWAPAVVHFAIQAGPKLFVPNDPKSMFPLVWIAACAVIPFGVFLVREKQVGAG